MPAQDIEFQFPLKGLNDGWAYGKRPPLTAPDAQNVMPFDPIESRARGGQRPGLSKYYSALHNGAESIQAIHSLVEMVALGGGTYTAISDTFTQGDGVLSTADWVLFAESAGTYSTTAAKPLVVSNALSFSGAGAGPTTDDEHGAFHKTATLPGVGYSISADVTLVAGTYKVAVHFYARMASTTLPKASTALELASFMIDYNSGTPQYTVTIPGATTTANMTAGSSDWKDPTYWATAKSLKLVVNGNTFSLYAADVLLKTGNHVGNPDGTYVGVGLYRYGNGATDNVTIDNYLVTQAVPHSGHSYKLVVVSGGDVYTGYSNKVLTAATSGANVLSTTAARIGIQEAFEMVYFADRNANYYRYLNLSTDTVHNWITTDGELPVGSNETYYNITAVDQGNKKFTVAEDLSSVAVGDYIQVYGSTGNDDHYIVNSLTGTGPTVFTVNKTIADATVDGTLRYAPYGCEMMKLYRGRIVLAGLHTDPHNWFMSAVGDPLDWDYAPTTTTATMAVAGNNTEAGKVGDVITCLAPYSDDLMIMGGDHTVWVMRGDPAAGGNIDNVSYKTGIAGPDAYTFDPNGIFYFFGTGQLWRMPATVESVPESMSSGRMDVLFRAFNRSTHKIRLHWSNDLHGLFIFVIPTASGATTHYFWDQRTDSFWKVVFPNDAVATAYSFDGDDPDDSRLLLGGWDGYIRAIDRTADDDDGTAITSYVVFTPINSGGIAKNTKLTRIDLVLDEESDDATLGVYAEESVQKALELDNLVFARTVSAGNNSIINRANGNTLILRLSNSTLNTQWAMETGLLRVELTGHTRKKAL